MLKIVFAGTGDVAVALLEVLSDDSDFEIKLVITQHGGRESSPVGALASSLGFTVVDPKKIGELEKDLQGIAPDALVVADYGQIIPKAILNIPRLGAINVHPSLLPKHRGPSPIVNSILAGDQVTGTTIMLMDDKMDHGPILAQQKVDILENENAINLEKRLATISASLLVETIKKYASGEIQTVEQGHSLATSHGFTKRGDGELSVADSVRSTLLKYRAFVGWPGIWFKTSLRGKEVRVKILEINFNLVADLNRDPTIQSLTLFESDGRLLLNLKDGAIEILNIQVEGGNSQDAKSFINGYKDVLKA